MGQINKKHRFLEQESMLESGVYVNRLLLEMEELALELKQLVDVELQYGKGEIIEKVLTEVEKRKNEQLILVTMQSMSVHLGSINYNEIYNDIAIQPITITYTLKKLLEFPTSSTIY